MGGIGAIGGISSYLIGSKDQESSLRHTLGAYISTGLFFLLLAAFYLDVYYYNELLRGAVGAILKLEEQYPNVLYMSTHIKEQFPNGARRHIYIAYGLVMFPLLIFVICAWSIHIKEKWLTRRSS